MIELSQEQLEKMRNHAERIYPEECCGLLLGVVNNNQKTLIEVKETENNWSEAEGSKRNRFSIDPKIILEIQKTARDRGLSIIGVYHSHPDNPAIPSEYDRAIAWSEYSYIIVSVIQGTATDLLCWCLDSKDEFLAEKIVTICS